MSSSETTLDTYNLADVWEAISERVPERTAVTCVDRVVTYGELEERSNRLANALTDAGVSAGDHVGILPPMVRSVMGAE